MTVRVSILSGNAGSVRDLIKDFGAPDDNVTDATTYVQAAIDWAKANSGYVYVPAPAVAYKITDELNCWKTTSGAPRIWGFVAPHFQSGRFMCHFNGYNKQVFKFRSGDLRSTGAEFRNIRVEYDSTNSTQNPVAFDLHGAGNMKMYGCSVTGGNNTQVRATTLFNCDGDDLVCFSGGRSFLYKTTSGKTFSITSSATTLTSSAAHFEAGDVGKAILVYDNTNSRSEKFVISAFTNTTTVTVATAATNTYTAMPGAWDHCKCNIAGTTLTALPASGVSVFATTDVGLMVYIQQAGASNRIHRATIASRTSSTVVELDTAAVNDVSGVCFTVPAVAFDDDTTLTSLGITNDFVFRNIHVENNNGVCLLQSGQSRLRTPDLKLHAQPSPVDTSTSLACLWLSKSDGYMSGTLEGRTVGSQGKIYAAGLAGQFKFGPLDVVVSNATKLCTEEKNSTDGLISFDRINVLNTISTTTKAGLFANESNAAPKIYVAGPLSCFGIAPTDFPESAPGGVFAGEYEIGAWTPALAGADTAGTFTYTTQLGRYTRIGRLCFIEARIVISAIGTPPVGNTNITGSPYTSVNVAITQPISIGRSKFNLATAGAWLTGHIINNTKAITLFECADNATPLNVNSATAIVADTEIVFNSWYEISLA